ncbi:MAG TPA: MFS transporter [Candidatus Saccharimonadales bacterium]|nr:MFS transporter [Candidatus Saccharimonadales bacterium]
MPKLLAPLRSRPFCWLMAGQALSMVGDRLNYLALVAVLSERTARFARAEGAGALSGLALALLLPTTLLSPWAAGRIDRWRRRDVLVAADVARAALTLGLAAALPALPTPSALVVVGLGTVANVFFLPARLALVPELVSQEELNPANALGLLTAVVATVVGMLVGGPLLAWIGARGALAVDGLTFAVSVGTLLQLPRRDAPPAQARSHWPGARSFARLFHAERVAAAALLLWTTWMVGALLHVCGTLRVQALSPRVTDLLAPALAALGAGGALGAAFFGSRLRRARSRLAGAGLVVAAGGLALLAVAHQPAWIVAAALVTGFASAPVYILADTELMECLEDDVRGGAMAARNFFCKGGFLVVALALGRWSGPGSAAGVLLAGAAGLAALAVYYAARRPLRT